MPHAKLPRKSTNIDMTAMCDVAFLLLTFFMLATKFKPDEPVVVKTPSSISEIPIPDNDIMLLTVDPKGRIFFSVDNPVRRKDLIDAIDQTQKLGLSNAEKISFRNGASVGVPFAQLKSYLSAAPADQKKMDQTAIGIPADTTVDNNPNNQLATWIATAREQNTKLRICIKADGDASYPSVQKIIRTLGGLHVFRFNLITGLKAVPVGTAAYADQHSAKK
jgi:biopolymer transport protein ExbD